MDENWQHGIASDSTSQIAKFTAKNLAELGPDNVPLITADHRPEL